MLLSVLNLLTANGPRIRRLILRERSYPGAELAASHLPALRTLFLGYAKTIDWCTPTFLPLRRSYLRGCGYAAVNMHGTFNDFLCRLQECQALEELELNLFSWPFSGPGNSRDISSDVTVYLPNMRKAQFLCPSSEEPDSPDIFHLLSHFRFPATANAIIWSAIAAATSGNIKPYSVTVGRCSGSGQRELSVHVDAVLDEWRYAPHQFLDDICTLLAHGRRISEEDLLRRVQGVMCILGTVSGEGELLVPELRSLALVDVALDRDGFYCARRRRDSTFTEVLGELGLDGESLIDGQIILEEPPRNLSRT
ncbi:hypothetical protein BD309DRAFT_1003934 [Dichomitus squalens]|uniref:Uncharacterized protein n=1 Tax=Dichomitus squalens TaxID=114155 RepID=A0A4Q9NHI6_9APHY|nr:hypothetical protein BD311DRAFT_841323 [Dichomitus squalens]TBU39112.1 hypothetical protein BD309DRAFT_1003934 [Dichomitus squalens]